jgi:hypothetical protein
MARRILIDPYDIRLHMAVLGWQSNDAIVENGSYTINFYRYDWQGVPVSQVSFYGRTHDLCKISETVARAGRLALRAWRDFPDDVPAQPNPDSEKLEIRQRLERDSRRPGAAPSGASARRRS